MGVDLASGAGRSRDVVGRWLLLVVALGGLFAMHGLSDHGVGAPAALHAVDGGAAHAQAGHAVAGHAMAGHAMDAPSDGSSEGSGGGHGDRHGGMLAGMCLAVLGAVLLLGAAGWRARALARWRRVLADAPAAAAASGFWARARGPAPPDLRVLCIQRC